MELSIQYTINQTNYSQIHDHLVLCDSSFVTSLSLKVNLEEYSKKIFTHATRVEAWENARLIGLVAVYMNHPKNERAFITNVSLEDGYSGKGIAGKMMEVCIEEAKKHGYTLIELEVDNKNTRALGLYTKLGFGLTENSQQGSVKLALAL